MGRDPAKTRKGNKGRKKVNTFREWLSDNLRYILLLLAILCVALLGFFGIRFLRGRNAPAPQSEPEETAEISEFQSGQEGAPAVVTTGPEDRKLNEEPGIEGTSLINRYYGALSAQDVNALRETLDELSDEDAAKFVTSVPITYSDVKVYVKPGPDASSSVAYVYYHYLEEGAEKALPGLSSLFLVKNASGSYIVKTAALTAEEEAYMNAAAADADIQDLIRQVQAEYDAANTSESGAAPSEAPASAEAPESSGESSSEEAPESGSSDGSRSRILQDCNVRAGAGYNYNPIGVIPEGTEVTIIGERGKGWTHIQGGGFDGYVGTTFLE